MFSNILGQSLCYKDEKPNVQSFVKNLDVIQEKPSGSLSRHLRMKSIDISTPIYNLTTSKKSVKSKKQRKSISTIKDLEKTLNPKKIQKVKRRHKQSLSNSKNVFYKQSRLSFDVTDHMGKLMMYKGSTKTIKTKKSASQSRKANASSKLSKHIEEAFGYKSSVEKKKGGFRKLKNRHSNPPLPIINFKQ